MHIWLFLEDDTSKSIFTTTYDSSTLKRILRNKKRITKETKQSYYGYD